VRRLALALLALLALGGCGGGDAAAGTPRTTPSASSAAPGARRVIRRWADTLRHGNVPGAARLFALPAVISNGTPPVEAKTRAQVVRFNRALPCGAVLRSTVARGPFVFGVFELTDRTGAGAQRPCQGKGNRAAVAFRIAGGLIREWRRVDAVPRGHRPERAPSGPVTRT
jgi:hypothetical protein